MLTRRALTLALAASTLGTRPALADKYPVRPIKMIAPFTAGSPVGVVARLLAQQLSAALPQSVVVENPPGPGPIIGMKGAATAQPDRYTLLFPGSSLAVPPPAHKNP